jgi:hypothetical protein
VLGYPIRKSPDQRQVGDSPRLNAASHVLHRLLMPRHPPCALKNLATKMLASTMQFTNNKQKPAHPAPRHPTPQSSHPTDRTGMTRDQPQQKTSHQPQHKNPEPSYPTDQQHGSGRPTSPHIRGGNKATTRRRWPRKRPVSSGPNSVPNQTQPSDPHSHSHPHDPKTTKQAVPTDRRSALVE